MYDILQLNDMLVPELLDIAEQLKIPNSKKLDKQELFIKFSINRQYCQRRKSCSWRMIKENANELLKQLLPILLKKQLLKVVVKTKTKKK